MRRTPMPARVVPLRTKTPPRPRVAGLRRRRRRHMATNTPAVRDDLTATQRRTLYARSGGCCECCGLLVPYGEFEAAHRQARGQGGNNVALWNRWVARPFCHRLAARSQHNNPLPYEERGLYVRSTGDPEYRPVLLPDGRVVRFTADGRYLEVG
jgi:hypothetical protein